jgi:hypothetical protein
MRSSNDIFHAFGPREQSDYFVGNRPAPGVIATVKRHMQGDPNAKIWMTFLQDSLCCMKHEKNLTAKQMQRLSCKAFFDWFEEGDNVMLEHPDFDPLPTPKDVRKAINRQYGYPKKPYKEKRPKCAFTKKPKAATRRAKAATGRADFDETGLIHCQIRLPKSAPRRAAFDKKGERNFDLR